MNHRSQCGLFHLQNQFVFLFQTVWTPSEPAVIYQTFTASTCIQIELQTAVCAAAAAASAKQLWGETFSFSFWCPFRSARSSDRGASDSVQIQGQLNVCHKKNPRVKTLRFCLTRLPERGQTFQNRLHHLDSYEYESRRGLSVRLIKNETWRTFSK